MRRPTSALAATLAAIGLSAPLAGAQQSSPAPASARTSAEEANPAMQGRPARYLLRNGMDYLAYKEYGRALSFLRAVEARQKELNDAERASLKKAIARAQEGLREPVNATQVASGKGRPKVQAGAFALAPAAEPAPVSRPAPAPAPAPEPVQLTAATLELAAAAPIPTSIPSEASAPVFGGEAPALPTLPPATPSAMGDGAPMPALPAEAQAPTELPTPLPEITARPEVPAEPLAAPTLPDLGATPTAVPTLPAAVPDPAPVAIPLSDPATAPTMAQPPAMPEAPAPQPAAPMPFPEVRPSATVEPSPAPEADALPPLPGDGGTVTEPRRSLRTRGAMNVPTILSPRLQEEVDRIAQNQPNQDRQLFDRPPMGTAGDPNASMQPIQGSTRLELPRAPSPTEARPLRRVPVPEEFESLAARNWDPNRKYWAAAATCHMPLYFQDAVLERYGQSAEQALGPNGRFFSYPLDDPRQSNQRNQILQPFASIGLFCYQIGTLPYKMFVDPPWEAEYDLGYYRPGDRIPPDTIYAQPTGLGPPGHGRKY